MGFCVFRGITFFQNTQFISSLHIMAYVHLPGYDSREFILSGRGFRYNRIYPIRKYDMKQEALFTYDAVFDDYVVEVLD
jgi:hypothetical protein